MSSQVVTLPYVSPLSPRKVKKVSHKARILPKLWPQQCPTSWANPYRELTDLFCRLPLPTLFYQLEAFHLGDLLRLWVRLGVKIKALKSTISPLDFHGLSSAHRTPLRNCGALPDSLPYLQVIWFQGGILSSHVQQVTRET